MARCVAAVARCGRRGLAVFVALLLATGGLPPGWGGGVARAAACAVTSPFDNGAGTLRAAMQNASCDAVTIDIDFGGSPGIIVLSSGLPIVLRPLSIAGPGASQLSILGKSNSDVFIVGMQGNLTVSGLTIEGANNAFLVLDGALRVTNSTLSNNGTGVFLSAGSATVTSSTIDN